MPDIQELQRIYNERSRCRASRRELQRAPIREARECPLCHTAVQDFLGHALEHIRKNQAYGVRKWHGRTGSSTLTLFPIKRQLTWKESIRLRRRFEKDASALIDGRRVRLIERQSAILTPDSGRKVSFTKAHLLNECLRGME
jgi:hypothetical protein